jgi:hypothetical protein
MARKPLDPDEALAAPLYVLAVLLVLMPAIDFLQSVGGVQPSNVQWRFATVGLLSSFLLTPLLGTGVAMVVAAVRGHVLLQRMLAIGNLAASAVLLLLLAGFVLDVLQLRPAVPEEGRAAFQSASLRAMLKHAATVALLFFFGLRGLRISSWRRVSRAQKPSVVIVGK